MDIGIVESHKPSMNCIPGVEQSIGAVNTCIWVTGDSPEEHRIIINE